MYIEIEKIIEDKKYNVELKQKVNYVDPTDYLKTISAFANGYDIGYVIFGINDISKKIIGIDNVKKSYDEISNMIKNKIKPSITPIIDILNIQNKNIILVKVIPENHTPYYYIDGGMKISYIRKENKNVEANILELNDLILRGRNVEWDQQYLEDREYYSFNVLKEYFKKERDKEVKEKDLISWGLIKGNKISNAAILFSDQNTNKDSFISCTRWKGKEKIISKDNIECYGSILKQIKDAVEFIKKHISISCEREERVIEEYDIVALREAIINRNST